MKTTVELPESLLHQAMLAARVKTKTEAIRLALEELIKNSKVSALKQYKGKIDLELDLCQLRGR